MPVAVESLNPQKDSAIVAKIQLKESSSTPLKIPSSLPPVNELSLSKVTAMTSPTAVQASIGDAMAIDDSPTSNVQHTAVAQQTEDAITIAKQSPSTETKRPIPMEDEAISGEGLEGRQVQDGSHDLVPARSEQPASSQPDISLGEGFNLMSGGMNLDVLAAFANPMTQMNMFQQSMNGMGYYPPNTLPGMLTMPMAMDGPLDNNPYLGPSPYPEEPEETRISAYAKLIFEDGHFYMNTYSVILGRDIAAWRAAMRAEKRRQEEEADAMERKTPVRIKHEESRYSKSIVSESGGILRHGDDSDPEERARRRKLRKAGRASKKSKSDGSSSARPSRRNSAVQAINTWKTYQPQQLQSKEAEPAPVNPATFRPSPYDCPLVAIHPPATAPISAYKSISREHVKIAYNSKKSVFEAIILGRNGCFIEDQWYHPNDVVSLESGNSLQIGGITVRFMLPNQLDPKVTEQHEDYEDEPILDRYSEGGKEMSLEFTDERREGAIRDTSEEDSDGEENRSIGGEQHSDGMEENELEEDEQEMDEDEPDLRDNSDLGEDDEQEAQSRVKQEQPQVIPVVEKKRGPGRPPKNGIMSKREQKQAKKEEQVRLAELAKKGKTSQTESKPAEKSLPQAQPAVPTKNKVGRPRKHPLPETPEGPPREKRKYTKRKPKEPKEHKEGEGKGSGSGSEDGGKPKKEKAPPRPPRSPSPVMKEEDYTPEQLAKPQANYVILIHEALSNAPTQQLGLPDIYRAIYRRYPYFKLKTQTLGWQSSVRHNLSQHPSFRKVEKDGKGWTWGIVDGISIEKEKKKRVTPPPPQHHGQMPHQPLYPGHPHMMAYGPPPPGYMMPPNMPPGQLPQYMMHPHMTGHPPPMLPHMNGNMPPNPYMTGPPSNFAAKIPPQLAAPNVQTSYSSPYATKPTEQTSMPPAPPTESRPSMEAPVPIAVSETPKPQPPLLQSQPPQQPQSQIPDSQLSSSHPAEQQPIITPPLTTTVTTTAPTTAPPSQPQPSQSQHPMEVEAPTTQIQPPTQDQTPTEQAPQVQRATSKSTTPANDPVQETVMQAAQSFGKTIIEGMKVQTPNAEAIVNSAINQVLRITTQSAVPGNNLEEVIMKALRDLLSQIPGSNIEPGSTSSGKPFLTTAEAYQAQASRPVSNHNRSHIFQQSARSGGDERSVPAVTRPSFHAQGQNRQNGTPVPRPPMISPNQKRTNSEGPVHAPTRPNAPSASPAPTPSTVDGANAAKGPANENGQIAGQKRPHDDTDDMQEFKRMSTSGPPQLKT